MTDKIAIVLILSIFLPGVGHMYLGRVRRGLAIILVALAVGLFLSWLFGWFAILAVLAFWIWQIYDAYMIAKRQSEPQPRTGEDFKKGGNQSF